MAKEIERKFLLKGDSWRNEVSHAEQFVQGYLVGAVKASVRIRIEGERAFLNIKSATLGVNRDEYEYQIPVGDAKEMLDRLCEQPLISKIRHHVPYEGKTWEIDEFEADNSGLIVAEIELTDENEDFERPPWLGEEVSHDARYYNVCLVKHPYSQWVDET